uniref:Transposase (Putative), gypsy type n=1 Tax=Tanacetum cinerariifolium TaxID=118510 RepID=A0A6L2LUM2_TANCI|nr:hypothetical protein [Tanacetum cinerariifolium]
MDLLSFIRIVDPTKVRIGERQRDEDGPKLLETTIGRVVPLLPVAPDRSSSELEASVDKLFDEGGSGEQAEQGHSASGGQGASIQPVSRIEEVVVEDVVPLQPMRKKKQKTTVVDAGEPSHLVKRLRDDHRTLGGTSVGGKSQEIVEPSLFSAGSASGDGTDPAMGGFADLSGSDFLIGGIRTVISPDTDLQKVYVPQWSVTNGSCLDDGCVCREMVDEFSPPMEKEIVDLRAQLLVKEAEAAKAIRLRVEASQFEVVEKFLRDEVQTLTNRNATLERKKGELDVKATDLAASVKVKEQEIADLDVVVTSVKLQNDNLSDQLDEFQDDRIKEMNDKFDKLDTDLVEMPLYLEERFYPHLLTTIFGRRWLLTYGLELAIAKCLNSTKYLSTLRAAIGKAVEKGMQDGLSARITHGAEGRVLADVAAYNPSAETGYLFALQRLQSVNFSLIAELKSNKDAIIDTIMNLLRLEDSLAEKLGLTKSQPHVDQLMVPIHHSPYQRVVGASALSLSLDVSSSRVRRIKENIAKHRSALRDVFVPLFEPLFVTALTGTESTLNVIPATVDTTQSVTSVFASLIPSISADDYEISHAEGGESVGADVNPFPNVDDAELNTS